MRIVCPECHAVYRINTVQDGTVLVCHRCSNEFPVSTTSTFKETAPVAEKNKAGQITSKPESGDIEPDAIRNGPQVSVREIIPEFIRDTPAASTDEVLSKPPQTPVQVPGTQQEDEQTEPPLLAAQEMPDSPKRRSTSIWPWLLAMLLLIAAAGFWMNREAWLTDPWLRSVLINMDMPLEPRDSDWEVASESVRAQWVKRIDGTHVLVIEGRVRNRLQAKLPPPRLKLHIFAAGDAEQLIREYILPITQPPVLNVIRHAPFSAPPEDTVPVRALGDRGFILVLENAPDKLGDFTLQPVAHR